MPIDHHDHPGEHEHHADRSPSALLRRAGLRATEPRLRVLRVLTEASGAISAGDVIERLSKHRSGGGGGRSNKGRKGGSRGTSQGADHGAGGAGDRADKVTVYRTLNALVEANLAHRVDTGDRVFRYSLTDHSHCRGEHHDHDHPHVVCDSCGRVECIEGAEVTIVSKTRGSEDAREQAAQPGSRDASDPTGAASATPSAQETLARFRVTRQDVTLHGVCDDCRQ